jgi:tRNA(Ile)-lysidine synthase
MPWRALDVGAARDALQAFARQHRLDADVAPLALAFSGGADSTALLVAALQHWGAQRLRVLHVDHGLQADAARFVDHARALCAQWGVALEVLRVEVGAARGDSVEERARDARYAALIEAARGARCSWLFTAHQADDQVETVLLALLRGAGPKGLAAMPAASERGGVRLGRPLLGCGAAELRERLDAQRVPYLIDAMNADPAWRRSRIRHELLPVIAGLEPAYARTIARSARLCAQTAAALRERAEADLAACRDALGDLCLAQLRELAQPRLAEVLRAWLGARGVRSSAAQIDELCRQIGRSAHGAPRLRVRVGVRDAVWRDGQTLRCTASSCL